MKKHAASLVLQAFLLFFICCPALCEESPVLRALIVTCDRFLSQEETTPAAQENARLMAELLAQEARGYELIRS